MSECSCDVSCLTPAQALAGPVTCAWCAGPWLDGAGQYVLTAEKAEKAAGLLAAGGLVAFVGVLHKAVVVAADMVVAAPGRARVGRCPECDHGDDAGEPCLGCDGTGFLVWRACIRCGDPAWQWGSEGSGNDRKCASCRRCGHMWSVTDPGWLAQRVPERLLALAG